MEKHIYHFTGAHTFTDGRVISDDEFMSEPQVFSVEKNQELCNAVARTFDPDFVRMERELRKFERTEQRRKELAEQQRKINEELARL